MVKEDKMLDSERKAFNHIMEKMEKKERFSIKFVFYGFSILILLRLYMGLMGNVPGIWSEVETHVYRALLICITLFLLQTLKYVSTKIDDN